jgi:hypothetical protein
MKNLKYTLFFIVLTARLFAQNEMMVWDSIYTTPYEEKLHDIKWLANGDKLVAVGEAKVKGNRQGVFYVVDARNGKLLHREYYGGQRDEALLSVTQANDGTYYLVGYTETNGGTDGWMLHLDEKYQELPNDFKLSSPGNDTLKYIVWDKNNNIGVAIGAKKNLHNGYPWQVTIGAKGILDNKEIGDGSIESVRGLFYAPDGKIWAYGNSRKSDISAKNNLWHLQIKPLHTSGDVKIYDTRSPENVLSGCVNHQNELLFSGTKDGELAWLISLGTLETQEKVFSKETLSDESIPAVAASPFGRQYAVWQKGGQPFLLDLGMDLELVGPEQAIDNGRRFMVKRLIRMPGERLVVAGIDQNTSKGRIRIAIVSMDNGSNSVVGKGRVAAAVAPAGGYKLSCSEPVFEDEDGDGLLRMGERGSVRFAINNAGDTPFPEGTYRVLQVEGNDVIEVTTEKTGYLEYIAPGKSTIATIGLRSISQATDKKAVVLFMIDGVRKDTCKINIKTYASGSSTSYSFLAPAEVRNSNNDDVSFDNKVEEFEVLIRTPNPNLSLASLKPRLDGVELSINKEEPYLSDRKEVNGMYEYTFRFKLTNISRSKKTLTIYNAADKTVSDPLLISYTGNRPNLHIVGIGPSYGNLKFTAKDARDFIRAMYRQKGVGFFADVYVDSLIGPEATAPAINDLMEDLLNRSKPDYRGNKPRIRKIDYLVVFYSGHGIKINEKFRLEPAGYKVDRQKNTTVDYQEMVNDFLAPIECKTFVFIDACLSGAASKSDNQELAALMNWVNDQAPGITSMSSCSANESSWEYFERTPNGDKIETRGNGVFTKALLEAFDGQKVKLDSGGQLQPEITAVNDDETPVKYITIRHLDEYVTKRVPDILLQDKDLKNLQQHPKMTIKEKNLSLPFYYLKD